MDLSTHFVGNDVRESGFAQSGRAVEQDVVDRFFSLPRRFQEYGEVLFEAILADEFCELARSQRKLVTVFRQEVWIQGLAFGHA